MHVLLATLEDAYDKKSWSGTAYSIRNALIRKFDKVSVLCAERPKKNLISSFMRLVFGAKRCPIWISEFALKKYAESFDSMIARVQPDIVVAISSQYLCYSKTKKVPVVMTSDAPYLSYKSAYAHYEPSPWRIEVFGELEAHVGRNVDGLAFPTPWACAEAASRYDVATDKIRCIPLGANRASVEDRETVIDRVAQKSKEVLRILFVGKDWDRKGGPVALEILQSLHQAGIAVTLDIVGSTPEIPSDLSSLVNVHGFLSPDKLTDLVILERLYKQASFFVVPSRAECYGLVFAEAQSYGLPCVAFNIFGVPGVVENEVTGLLFDSDCPPAQIANRIAEIFLTDNSYLLMCMNARLRFDTELNWNVWGERMYSFAQELVSVRKYT